MYVSELLRGTIVVLGTKKAGFNLK